MIGFEKEINNVKIVYNCLLDLANVCKIEKLKDKVNIDYLQTILMETIKREKGLIKDNGIMDNITKELTKEVLRVYNLISKIKVTGKTREVEFEEVSKNFILSSAVTTGKELSVAELENELGTFVLMLGASPIFGVAQKSFIDPDSKLTKANEDAIFLNRIEDLGVWIKKNRNEVEYSVWQLLFKGLEVNPRNKKQKNKVLEYYDFLSLTDSDLVYKYGADYANGIMDKFTNILLEKM